MRNETEMIAYALEIQPSLLAYVPELLADFDELGSDAELVVEVLDILELPDTARVIDLGCGKGAVSVEIAEQLGCKVFGIELFEPFISLCRQRAIRANVAKLCEFRQGDILKLAGEIEPADVVVFAALGDVLGPLDETMGVIRQFVKSGGYIIVADGYLKAGGSTAFPGFENYAHREETLRRLTARGDKLVREVMESPRESDIDEETEMIRRRAAELLGRHPELEAELEKLVKSQGDENLFIAENFVSTVWVLRKSE